MRMCKFLFETHTVCGYKETKPYCSMHVTKIVTGPRVAKLPPYLRSPHLLWQLRITPNGAFDRGVRVARHPWLHKAQSKTPPSAGVAMPSYCSSLAKTACARPRVQCDGGTARVARQGLRWGGAVTYRGEPFVADNAIERRSSRHTSKTWSW
jgi:hypothetical protein